MRVWGRFLATLAFVGLCAGAAQAQDGEGTRFEVRSQVLTIDSARLFPETLLGQTIIAAIEQERLAFARENQLLASQLRAEELDITERRDTLSREEFARIAEEFDQRVQELREDRDAAEIELEREAERQELAFLAQVQPVLAQIMAEAGAAVLIEADTVVLRNDVVDITDVAIARINAATRASADPVLEDTIPDPAPAE